MSKRNSAEKTQSPSDSRRARAARAARAAKGALMVAGAGAGAVVVPTAVNALATAVDQTKGYESDRAVEVRGINQAYGNVIVLKSGARYRITPTDYGRADNNPTEVPKGKELVIDTPTISPVPSINTLDEPNWIGFTLPGTNVGTINSPEDRAEATVYANLHELVNEGLAQVYPNEAAAGQVLSAYVTDTGAISVAGKIDANAGTSYLEQAGDFQQASGSSPSL